MLRLGLGSVLKSVLKLGLGSVLKSVLRLGLESVLKFGPESVPGLIYCLRYRNTRCSKPYEGKSHHPDTSTPAPQHQHPTLLPPSSLGSRKQPTANSTMERPLIPAPSRTAHAIQSRRSSCSLICRARELYSGANMPAATGAVMASGAVCARRIKGAATACRSGYLNALHRCTR